MAFIVLLVAIVALTGCVRHAKAFAPHECIGPMTVKDFTKPCTPISSTELMCDRVRVEINCIRYKQEKK